MAIIAWQNAGESATDTKFDGAALAGLASFTAGCVEEVRVFTFTRLLH